jgi:hypothetical protein
LTSHIVGDIFFDDVRLISLSDPFAPKPFRPFSGTLQGSNFVATDSDLRLTASFSATALAIHATASLESVTTQNRAVQLAFRVPVDAASWRWYDDLDTSTNIKHNVSYTYISERFLGNTGEFIAHAWSAINLVIIV